MKQYVSDLLHISTSKRVLRMPFAGQNHFFLHFHIFQKKQGENTQKHIKSTLKSGVPVIRCYS